MSMQDWTYHVGQNDILSAAFWYTGLLPIDEAQYTATALVCSVWVILPGKGDLETEEEEGAMVISWTWCVVSSRREKLKQMPIVVCTEVYLCSFFTGHGGGRGW